MSEKRSAVEALGSSRPERKRRATANTKDKSFRTHEAEPGSSTSEPPRHTPSRQWKWQKPPAPSNDTGETDSDRHPEQSSQPAASDRATRAGNTPSGLDWGFVNAGNTCYIDSVIVAMFAATRDYDRMLDDPPESEAEQMQQQLKDIVTSFRRRELIQGKPMFQLRISAIAAGWLEGVSAEDQEEQQDAGEFFSKIHGLLRGKSLQIQQELDYEGKVGTEAGQIEPEVSLKVFLQSPLLLTGPVELYTLMRITLLNNPVKVRKNIGGEEKNIVAELSHRLVDVGHDGIIPICLKRYRRNDRMTTKDRRNVYIPDDMDFAEFFMNDDAPNPPQSRPYKLMSVVCHSGDRVSSGHYTAYVKVDDNLWLKYDDTRVAGRVEVVENESIERMREEWLESAYLLWFAKENNLYPDLRESMQQFAHDKSNTQTLNVQGDPPRHWKWPKPPVPTNVTREKASDRHSKQSSSNKGVTVGRGKQGKQARTGGTARKPQISKQRQVGRTLEELKKQRYSKTHDNRPPDNNVNLFRLQSTYDFGVDSVRLVRPQDPTPKVSPTSWDVPELEWVEEANNLFWDAKLTQRTIGWLVKYKAVKTQKCDTSRVSTVLVNLDEGPRYKRVFKMQPYCRTEDGDWVQHRCPLEMQLNKSSAIEYIVRKYLCDSRLSIMIDKFHKPSLCRFVPAVDDQPPQVTGEIKFSCTFAMALHLLGAEPDSHVTRSVWTRYRALPKYYRDSVWAVGIDKDPQSRPAMAFIGDRETLEAVTEPGEIRDQMLRRMEPHGKETRYLPIVFKAAFKGCASHATCYRSRISYPKYISKPPAKSKTPPEREINNPSTKPSLRFALLQQADPQPQDVPKHVTTAKAKVATAAKDKVTLPEPAEPESICPGDDKYLTFEAGVRSITGAESVESLTKLGEVAHEVLDSVTVEFRARFDLAQYCSLLDMNRQDPGWVEIVDELCTDNPDRVLTDAQTIRVARKLVRTNPAGFAKYINKMSAEYTDRAVHVFNQLLGIEEGDKDALIAYVENTSGVVEVEEEVSKIQIKKGKKPALKGKKGKPVNAARYLSYGKGVFTLQYYGYEIRWTAEQFKSFTGIDDITLRACTDTPTPKEAQELMLANLVVVRAVKTPSGDGSLRSLDIDIAHNYDPASKPDSFKNQTRKDLVERYKITGKVASDWLNLPDRAERGIAKLILDKACPERVKPKKNKGVLPYYERVEGTIYYVQPDKDERTMVHTSDTIAQFTGNRVRVTGHAKAKSVFEVVRRLEKHRSVTKLRRSRETISTQLDLVDVDFPPSGNHWVARKLMNQWLSDEVPLGIHCRDTVCSRVGYEYFNKENLVLDMPPEADLPRSKYLAIPCLAYHGINPETSNALSKNNNIRLLDHGIVRHNVFHSDARFSQMELMLGPGTFSEPEDESKMTRVNLNKLKVPAPLDQDRHFQLRQVRILIPRVPHLNNHGIKLSTQWSLVHTDEDQDKELIALQYDLEARAKERAERATRENNTPSGLEDGVHGEHTETLVDNDGRVIGIRRPPRPSDFPDNIDTILRNPDQKMPFFLNPGFKLSDYIITVVELVDRPADQPVVRGKGFSDIGISTAHSIYDPDNHRFWEFGRGASRFLCNTLTKRVDKARSDGDSRMVQLWERVLRQRVRRLHEVWLAATLALFSELVYSFGTMKSWMKSEQLSSQVHRRVGVLSLCSFHDKLLRATSSPRSTCRLTDLGDEKFTTCILSCCGRRLKNVGCKKVLYCHACQYYIPRDFNGAVNCYRLYLSRTQPGPTDLSNEGGPTGESVSTH